MTKRTIPITALALIACKGGGSSNDDWTKAKTKHYTEMVKDVAFALDAPEGRKGKLDTNNTGWDYWLMHELGYSPSVAIALQDRAETLEDDLGYRMAKSEGNVVSTETFANGFAYTEKVRDTYHAKVVLHIASDKSIACDASAGGLPVDPDVKDKLPALQAICRSLDVGGIKLRSRGAAAAMATPGAAPTSAAESTPSGLPAECTAYIDLMSKLASCNQLDADKRDGFKFAAESTPAVWSKLPDERKAALPAECKAAAESLSESAKLCGV